MTPESTTNATRPEQTTRYRLVQQHAETFIAQAEEAGLPTDAGECASNP